MPGLDAGHPAGRDRPAARRRDLDAAEGEARRGNLRAAGRREAARAEALVLDELAGKTYSQVERLAWRAALAVAPDVAERRRSAAERQARVTVFREESGAVGLSGRDLPAAEALAGHANVVARARQYQASGAFDGQSDSRLEALAYVHLLNGVSARERIAFAASAAAEPPGGPGPDDEDGDGDAPTGRRGRRRPGPVGSTPGARPAGMAVMCDGRAPATTSPARDGPVRAAAARAGRKTPRRGCAAGRGNGPAGHPATPRRARRGQPAARPARPGPGPRPRRRRSPLTRLPLGSHRGGRARLRHRPRHRPPRTRREPAAAAAAAGPASCALPARVNITVTETFLHQLAQAAQPRSGRHRPAPGSSPPANPGTWTLTLPGGRQLTVRFDVVPTHDCDHRYQVSSYLPGDRLRRLVQVRDHTCTWPPCSRPARESDFEHAVPYDKGGVTDACNAGARSRRCHQVKQMPGWTVTQPKPGWHVWTTPTGRT